MAEFQVNKGVGKQVEFQGLTSQYLFLFVGGLLATFICFVVMYMASVTQSVCILFAVTTASLLTFGIFRLNRTYGPHGLQKLLASKQHPRRIIHRRSVRRLLKTDRTSKP